MFKRKSTPEEKIGAVEAYLRGEIALRLIMNQYGVAKESFYKWVQNYEIFGPDGLQDKHTKTQYSIEVQTAAVQDYLSGVGSQSDHEAENEALLHEIGLIYAEHNGTYGYRRIADEYNAAHEKQYNLKRFYRLIHIVGLLAVIRRKRPAYQRSKPEVTAENLLNRDFTANTVNEKWCTDVTEMKYGSEGEKAYLSAILDLKGRDIVSFAIGKSNNQLVFETFDLAVQKYPDAHPLFHSDRGFQYTNKQFKAKLDKQKMQQSMSRVGRCIDNGPMEGFWGTLKCEMYYISRFDTYEELVVAVEQFIHYYNHERRQHKLNCLPPATYRSLLEAA